MGEQRADESGPEGTQDEFDRALDQEWYEARRLAQGSQQPGVEASFSPYLLLYSGFLLGPAATWVLTFLIVPRKPRLRQILLVLGLAGATWSILQGLTWQLNQSWSFFALQSMRTGFNLALGLVCILVLNSWHEEKILHTRQTLINTLVLGGLMIVTFVTWMSSPVLVWMGR